MCGVRRTSRGTSKSETPSVAHPGRPALPALCEYLRSEQNNEEEKTRLESEHH